ncbi:hypothetical protein [uncultured Mediterranean phage uvMED]|jgi:hypothetical protein|nr:hypothetical protein [uncultured Mediterranean phage uvMED]
MTKDKMIKKIMQRMSKRADDGIKKYGSTMLHSRKSFVAWIDDAQEELWDAIVYLEKLKTLMAIEVKELENIGGTDD